MSDPFDEEPASFKGGTVWAIMHKLLAFYACSCTSSAVVIILTVGSELWKFSLTSHVLDSVFTSVSSSSPIESDRLVVFARSGVRSNWAL